MPLGRGICLLPFLSKIQIWPSYEPKTPLVYASCILILWGILLDCVRNGPGARTYWEGKGIKEFIIENRLRKLSMIELISQNLSVSLLTGMICETSVCFSLLQLRQFVPCIFYYCRSSGVVDLHVDLLVTTHTTVSMTPLRKYLPGKVTEWPAQDSFPHMLP